MRNRAATTFVALALSVLLAPALSACKPGGVAAPLGKSTATSPAGEKVSLQLDQAKAQSKSITATEGATFALASADGTAAVIVMPRTFPDGTRVTFTPLADATQPGARLGFDITAEGGAQPSLPVFVVYETSAVIPADTTFVAYGDDSDTGVPLAVDRSADANSNYLVAQVTHFTVFRVDVGLPKVPPPTDKNNGYQSGFKQWAIKVNDTESVDDGMWLGDLTFEMDVRTPAGDIMGPYNGQGTYDIKLDMSPDIGVLAGNARGAWAGPVNFSPCRVNKFNYSYTPTAGGIKPGLGFWLAADGDFTAKEITPFTVDIAGPDIGGNADLSPFAPGVIPMTLFISESGATVELAGHTFKGFVIGTLAEDPAN